MNIREVFIHNSVLLWLRWNNKNWFSEPAQPTDQCPHQYGYFKLGDEHNCGQFMTCVEGRAYIFHCPEGLAYNSKSYRCDWPDQVPDCDAESKQISFFIIVSYKRKIYRSARSPY